MNINFINQNILVTGGTRGIGKQIANDFARLGANVLITGTKEPDYKFPKNIHFLRVDFLEKKSVDEFVNLISRATFDVCINNAGINRVDSFCDIKENDWNDILKVNLTAPFRVQQAVTKNMVKRNYGRIINISSIWGTISTPHRASYSASKFGLRGTTLAAAAELAQYNILINTVSPGFTLTDLTRSILGPERMKELEQQIPMKRMAAPKEISNVVLFMTSKMNTYISGQNIIVDGGFVNV